MIKKFLIDGIVLCGVALIAFVFAQKPALDWSPASTAGSKPVKGEKAAAQDRREAAPDAPLVFLKKRNIFALDGSYKEVKAATLLTIPENPYTLLAILQGKERNALFREFTGAVIAAPLHKKMIDGFVVTRISDLNVQLKRGKETKELGVFIQMAQTAAKTEPSTARGKTASGNLYSLVGVLQGEEKAGAILKDAAGNIITARAGQIMEDGFILSRIDSISVQFKRGKEVKELKLFDPSDYIKTPPVQTQKQPSGSANIKKTGATSGPDMIKKPAKAKPGASQ